MSLTTLETSRVLADGHRWTGCFRRDVGVGILIVGVS
jgi:hypothetical protein